MGEQAVKQSKFQMVQGWIDKNLGQKMQKLSANPWLGGMTDALMKLVPLTMISSIVTIYSIIRNYIETLPSMGAITNYTFGISGLAMAYLIPFHISERLGNRKKTYVALTSIGMYLMAMAPIAVDEGMAFNFNYFGNAGMFVAIVFGLFTAWVFNVSKKINIFKEGSGMPDFCVDWFDTLIPMAICMMTSWILTIILNLEVYGLLTKVFQPLTNIVNSIPGFCIVNILATFMYTCGISTWVFEPVTAATRVALSANVDAYAAGARGFGLPYHAAGSSITARLGGSGNTMALNILFLLSKSKRLKTLGKVYFIPSLLNINEPIVFGTMLWNPILMIPAVLCEVVNYTLWWVFCLIGLCQPQHTVFSMWYAPAPIAAWIVNGIGGLLLFAVCITLDLLVYYPFFKIYEKNCRKEDGEFQVA